MQIRRIVTGLDANGRSTVVSDGFAPRTHDFEHIPGFSNTVVWTMDGAAPPSGTDRTGDLASLVPPRGATNLLVVQFPPESVFASIDHAAAAAEEARVLPGLADCFDPARPGFHVTPTIDQVIILDGELWLEMETGPEVLVKRGDVVIQNGAWHAWHNRSGKPAVVVAAMFGTGA